MTTQTATIEEVKKEEDTTPKYVPAELVSVEVDKNAVDFIKGIYEKWLVNRGAAVAKEAMALQERAGKIEALESALLVTIAGFEQEQETMLATKDFAGIAQIEAKKESAKAETAKQIAKLNGAKIKVDGQPRSGSGELTANKLTAEELRKATMQFSFGAANGKPAAAFVVIHSSRAKGKKTESDKWVAYPAQPVSAEKRNGQKFASGIPTISGKPVELIVEVTRGDLTHSGYTNGITRALRSLGLIGVGSGTAYQPFSPESLVIGAQYDFVVVKE